MSIFNKKNILSVVILLTVLFVVYIIFSQKVTYMPIHWTTPKMEINSSQLVTSFIENEKLANAKYVEEMIEVEGEIKSINSLNNTVTIILKSHIDSLNVICEMHPDQIAKIDRLEKGEFVSVKGICKGFLLDAILLNCIIVDNE